MKTFFKKLFFHVKKPKSKVEQIKVTKKYETIKEWSDNTRVIRFPNIETKYQNIGTSIHLNLFNLPKKNKFFYELFILKIYLESLLEEQEEKGIRDSKLIDKIKYELDELNKIVEIKVIENEQEKVD